MITSDVRQRVKLIKFFYSSERLIIQIQRKYHQHFNVKVCPCDNIIRKLIVLFERIASVGDLPETDT